jgi:hypothetical protein
MGSINQCTIGPHNGINLQGQARRLCANFCNCSAKILLIETEDDTGTVTALRPFQDFGFSGRRILSSGPSLRPQRPVHGWARRIGWCVRTRSDGRRHVLGAPLRAGSIRRLRRGERRAIRDCSSEPDKTCWDWTPLDHATEKPRSGTPVLFLSETSGRRRRRGGDGGDVAPTDTRYAPHSRPRDSRRSRRIRARNSSPQPPPRVANLAELCFSSYRFWFSSAIPLANSEVARDPRSIPPGV